MDAKLRVFLGVLALVVFMVVTGFILDSSVSARVVVSQPAIRTPTATRISFEYSGRMYSPDVQVFTVDETMICSGEDLNECLTSTPAPTQPSPSGRAFDCELSSRCLEVPLEPLGEYKFLATPAPP